jgi:DNA polymerase III subunit delta
MSTMHLLIGENMHELLQEKQRWIHEFERKFGSESYSRVDGSKASVRDLLDEVSVQPFLAEKRLVVVDGVPKATKEEIQHLSASIHPQNILLIVDAKPDKRSGGVKELLNVADVRTYPPKTGAPLKQWITMYVAQSGTIMSDEAITQLLELTGEDQAALASEIDKLAAFKPGGTVTAGDVEILCVPSEEGVVWKISDLLAAGSKTQALAYAHRLLDRGGDAYGLWAILTSMLKNLVSVYAAQEAGNHSATDIAESTGVHPFAVRSLMKHAQRTTAKQLQSFVSWAAESDIALKTGGLRATDEAPQEILALVDEFILRCP